MWWDCYCKYVMRLCEKKLFIVAFWKIHVVEEFEWCICMMRICVMRVGDENLCDEFAIKLCVMNLCRKFVIWICDVTICVMTIFDTRRCGKFVRICIMKKICDLKTICNMTICERKLCDGFVLLLSKFLRFWICEVKICYEIGRNLWNDGFVRWVSCEWYVFLKI